jgi:Dolichyl-phosphate-mannose-protein mannosyltransferase
MSNPEREGTSVPAAVYVLAAGVALLQLLANGRYGLFRDEFYYLACTDHLDWGYVDHPPLSIAVLWLVRRLLGDSLPAIRLVPALLGAVLVLLGARLAAELGGGRFARILAALSVAIAPQYLAIAGFYSMNAFDLVFWSLLALLLVRIVTTGDARLWLAFGALCGVALLNKISPLFFAAGLGAALVLTPLRRQLLRPQLWAGGALALALLAPHLLWQARLGWPTLEFMSNAQRYKIAHLTPVQFLAAQLLEIHPLNTPLWVGGLFFIALHRQGRRFRALAILYLTALALMMVQKSKAYYLGPAYPMLLAAGAVWAEGLLAGIVSPWLRRALLALLATGGALLLPFVVPVLPVEEFIAYEQALGQRPRAAENQELGPLPQLYADRFGWREMTAAVASTIRSLPEAERGSVLIATSNYGEAGALNYYGRGLGLPAAVSQHNSFYLWGPGRADAQVVIAVGMSAEGLQEAFESVEPAARVVAPYAMPYETEHPIHVCRRLRMPLAEVWKRGKHFI